MICMVRGGKRSARHQQRLQATTLENACRRAVAAGDILGLSAISVSELEFGASFSGRYHEEMAAIRKVLAPFKLLDYDALECPRQYGRIRHELEAAGQAIDSEDLMIAAHALALDAVLVTNNEAHFGRVTGLTVANWLKAS